MEVLVTGSPSATSFLLSPATTAARTVESARCTASQVCGVRKFPASGGECSGRNIGRNRSRGEVQARLRIDRRHHFEESLRRQEAEEAREAEAEITCPIDCVREVRTYAEFEKVLRDAESTKSLVVVDFYNSSCGSCKYILPQFIKLCKKGCGDECLVDGEKGVHFVKHNVHDDYDDLTDGCRVEQFPTRDRQKLELSVQHLLTHYFG